MASAEAGPSRWQRRPSNTNVNASSYAAAAAQDRDEAELDDIRRYESFSTVDWIVDSTRERARIARARQAPSSNSHLANGATTTTTPTISSAWGQLGYAPGERPPRWWPTSSPWGRRAWTITRLGLQASKAGMDSGVVILVGLLIGVNMALISIATEWASSLKTGYCRSGWWLNQKFCCWEMMDTAGPGGGALTVPPSVKASIAAASKVNSTSSLLPMGTGTSVTLGNLTSSKALARSAELLAGWYTRAADDGSATSDLSETCTDWVPWSSWTVPSWILYIGFSALLAFICAHLVRAHAPYAAGSGITEIKCILAGFIIHGFLGLQTLVIKSLSLPLAIASGLSVGKEGPAVHVACCMGNVVSGFFKSFDRSQAKRRELLTAASAAGVAVAFGSPIGGVLFSLEEMAYQFPATTMWRCFLCALAATVSLSFMNPFRTGKLVLFQVSYDRDWHYFEMIFYSIIGIFGGLYGAFVIKYHLQVQAFRRNNLAAHGVSEAVILAILTAFVCYWNKFLRIDMTESLEILFRECEGGGDYDNLCQSWAQWRMVNSLLLATVIRVALVILSYGCKVPAGIFVPSMAIGATFGRMLGILVKALYNAYPHAAIFSACQPDVPCITPGTYAFLGAAAALAGVTRITAAVVVIMFELTGALTYILPTMVVVMITKGVGDLYGKGGMAEQTMKFAGYPFLDKDEHNFGLLPVGEVMKKDPDVVFSTGMKLKEVEVRLNNTYRGFPVVRSQEDQTLLGYVGKTEVRYAIDKARRAVQGRGLSGDSTICFFTMSDDTEDGAGRADPIDQQPLEVPFDEEANKDGNNKSKSISRRIHEEDRGLIGELGDEDEDDELDHRRGESNDGLPSYTTSSGNDLGSPDPADPQDDLELGAYVDPTPLTVSPRMPLEVVMDLFKKMGPRVILVTDRQGRLVGLVTVKDLLKHIAAEEREEERRKRGNSGSDFARSEQDRLPTVGQSRDNRRAPSINIVKTGDLETLLSNAWTWAKQRLEGQSWTSLSNRLRSNDRRRDGGVGLRTMAGSNGRNEDDDAEGDESVFVLEEETEDEPLRR